MIRTEIENFLSRLNHIKALVIGDLMLDEYLWGKAERISPEAPVQVVDVTREGTGQGAFSGLGVSVAGKTGTAEVKGKDDYAWFCAYAPADQPRYAVAIVIEQGGHGGSVAGPAARNIIAKLMGKPLKTVRATDQSR